MTPVEIILIIIGIVMMIGSFFVEEKLSGKDLENISTLSEKELNIIMEKQLKDARVNIDSAITDIIDESMDLADRALKKETNDKIMAIRDYSDTVLQTMNKTHNEVMFLYSMLNDKQDELKGFMEELQKKESVLKEEASKIVLTSSEEKEPESECELEEKAEENIELDENHNESILELYRDGKDEVEIAKELGLGLGEVRLVIGLYKGESES